MKNITVAIASGAALLASLVGHAVRADGVPGTLQPPSTAASVVGPVGRTTALRDPAHGYPFNATPADLAKQGYVEEEFFIQGLANRYTTPALATGAVTDGNHPFKTRLVVRRPISRSKFNGTAIIEWTNVSQGHDNEVDWFQSGAHLVRAGYAWIGVSAQRVGVDALKQWSPSRYGTLDVSEGGAITNDALSYDIFTAAARAVKGATTPGVMGGLRVERLIATGHSQSAGRLYTYFTSVHPLAPIFDGVVLHGGGGILRPDLEVKVWKFLSETDVSGQTRQPDTDRLRTWEVAGTSHLDAQLSRGLGSVGLLAAGGAPVDGLPKGPTISGGSSPGSGQAAGVGSFQRISNQPNDGCAKPIFSRVPSYYVQNALYDHLARWIKDGTPPPTAPPIEMRDARPGEVVVSSFGPPGRGPGGAPPTGRRAEAAATAPGRRGGDGAEAPPAGGRRGGAAGGRRGGPPPIVRVIARDEAGNALGGVRLSQHAVPTAVNTGVNTALSGAEPSGGTSGNGGMFCGLLGSHEPFDAARLAMLYPTHDAYVAKVKEVTEKNLKWGYILKADADATVAEARNSSIGRR